MRKYLTSIYFVLCVLSCWAQDQAEMKSALLVMDMQYAIIKSLPMDSKAVTTQVANAIEHARNKNIFLIYVKAGFRPGLPEISPSNKFFSSNRENIARITEEEWKFEKSIAPLTNDIVVHKHRISAFQGTDLELILKANGISHLILTGISTSGVVLSTLREAADKDYRITVLSDACADRDEEVQRVLMTKLFPMQSEVITVKYWINN